MKDKLWFFASFNPTYASTTANRWFMTDPVNLAAAKVPGDTRADPQQGRQTYEFASKSMYSYWQAKLTAQPFKGMRVSLSGVSKFSKSFGGEIPSIAGTSNKNYPWNRGWGKHHSPPGKNPAGAIRTFPET